MGCFASKEKASEGQAGAGIKGEAESSEPISYSEAAKHAAAVPEAHPDKTRSQVMRTAVV